MKANYDILINEIILTEITKRFSCFYIQTLRLKDRLIQSSAGKKKKVKCSLSLL